MKYLLLLGLLTSCSNLNKNPVEDRYRMLHCGKEICQYSKSNRNIFYEEINSTNDSQMALGAYYSTIVCLVGMSFNESPKQFVKSDIINFNKQLGVDYILYEKVINEDVSEYEIKKNIIWFYVSKDKAKNCYDIKGVIQ
jgi:Zn/Cd-binding protein ZinT